MDPLIATEGIPPHSLVALAAGLGHPLDSAAEIGLEELPAAPQPILVDVRSPREFEVDHLPGSRTVPLFSDAERALVGRVYRERGPGAAQAWGASVVAGRLREFTEQMLEALEIVPGYRPAPAHGLVGAPVRAIVCARGGLRSEAVVRYLRGLGYPALRLRGGYRAWRARVRSELARVDVPPPFVLTGLTGTGKTLVLRAIAERFPGRVIDLEEIARHRSSVLGDIGLTPVSQRGFESRLTAALAKLSGPWSLFEWEGRRLGDRELPATLYELLRAAPHIALEADLERRIDILCGEYLAGVGVAELRARLPAFRRFAPIGSAGVRELELLLDAGEFREVARRLVTLHYDPRYRNGHAAIPIAHRIVLSTIEETAAAIIAWVEARH